MAVLAQALVERRWRQAKLLVDIGCNVNAKADNGRTPLIELCFVDDQNRSASLAKILLDKGAIVGVKDNQGRTALSTACLLHRTKLFPLLIKYVDFDLNSADKDGNTALFHAITAGDVRVVSELLAKMKHFGLKVDVLNKKGETPLIYALKSKKLDIADVLVQMGKASLEARDLEHQKSASQWREEISAPKNTNSLPVLLSKPVGEHKIHNESKKSKTGSARLSQFHDKGSLLPELLPRPSTAPCRIIVPDFLRPCIPIKTSLAKLYMIHNQQSTDSFRYGYKPVKYTVPIGMEDEFTRRSITFNQVNDITVKLNGLYKDSTKRRGVDSSSKKGIQCKVAGSNERPSSRSIAKGTKVLKSLSKSVQQFELGKTKVIVDES